VRAGNVTYVNATDYEDPSPQLTPDLPLGGAEAEDTLPPLPSPTPPSPPPPPPLVQGQQVGTDKVSKKKPRSCDG